MCNFVGFGYGIFDLWIQFREYAFDDTNVRENSTAFLEGGTFSNVVTSAYEWVKNHQLPLSGLIVTTPRFVFVWFVEFKFMQIRRWNANTLT